MEWVSVEDRKPECLELVLITNGKLKDTAVYSKACDTWDLSTFNEDYFGAITHWMPLDSIPEPPQ